MSKNPRPKRPGARESKSSTRLDERWLELAREVAHDPDSPTSLRIMSAVSEAMRPSCQAAAQVIEALTQQIDHPDELADAAVTAAVTHWESVSGAELPADVLEQMRAEAMVLVQRRRRQPPPMESIITGVGEPVDIGYDMSLHLHGLRGTWHRLWASIALGAMLGESTDQSEAVATVRAQFEKLLGRELSADEWLRLSQHARVHGETVQGEMGQDGKLARRPRDRTG